MKINNQSTKYVILASAIIVLAFGIFAVAPARANAFDLGQIIDPLCLFACDDTPRVVNKTYTNSNNVNSNINSPGAVVNTTPTQVAYIPPTYNYPPYPQYPPLQVSCYVGSSSVFIGDTVNWTASVSGGDGSYYYTWSGTEGLSGYGASINKTYYSPGYKTASVTVTSDGQTISRGCNGSVNVQQEQYYYNPQPYYPPTQYYNPLSVSCSANTTSASVGSSVRWSAYVYGGNSGSYSYTWSGTDGIYGSGQSIYYTYNNPGYKTASVSVYSNGQTANASCNNTVNITGYNYNYGVYNSYNYNSNIDNNSGLDVACYSDPTTARVNQPVTWRAEVVGGSAPYTYSWSGTNNLSGSDSTVIKYYSSTGDKSGIVTIRSADGRTATRACSTGLTIRSASTGYVAPAPVQPVVQPVQPINQDDNPLSAAALFSLRNVPWGWVAILIILVLFGTVVYLIFNRQKI